MNEKDKKDIIGYANMIGGDLVKLRNATKQLDRERHQGNIAQHVQYINEILKRNNINFVLEYPVEQKQLESLLARLDL